MDYSGTIIDETVAFINTNTPHGGSPEDTVKVYTLSGSSPYNKVKDFLLMGV